MKTKQIDKDICPLSMNGEHIWVIKEIKTIKGGVTLWWQEKQSFSMCIACGMFDKYHYG